MLSALTQAKARTRPSERHSAALHCLGLNPEYKMRPLINEEPLGPASRHPLSQKTAPAINQDRAEDKPLRREAFLPRI